MQPVHSLATNHYSTFNEKIQFQYLLISRDGQSPRQIVTARIQCFCLRLCQFDKKEWMPKSTIFLTNVSGVASHVHEQSLKWRPTRLPVQTYTNSNSIPIVSTDILWCEDIQIAWMLGETHQRGHNEAGFIWNTTPMTQEPIMIFQQRWPRQTHALCWLPGFQLYSDPTIASYFSSYFNTFCFDATSSHNPAHGNDSSIQLRWDIRIIRADDSHSFAGPSQS